MASDLARRRNALPDGVATVGELMDWLVGRGGGYAEAFSDRKVVRVAVNQEYVSLDHPVAAGDEVPFAAVLVMCDPYEWYEALQISIDVLCSPTPLSLEFDTTAAAMPLHFSNPDFLSKFEH